MVKINSILVVIPQYFTRKGSNSVNEQLGNEVVTAFEFLPK